MALGLSRFRSPHQLESCSDGVAHQRLDLRNREPRQPVRETTNRSPDQPTGGDPFESGQLTIHIEGQTVLGDPAAAADADGRNLPVLQPQPGQTRLAFTFQAKRCQHVDQHLLQLTHVVVQIRTVPLQIENRINHQLTRQVMGHLTPAIDAMQRDW